jgi:hypothetical protein
MERFRIGIGILLCLLAGVLLGDAWTGGGRILWWTGAITLLAGASLVTSGARRRTRPLATRASLLTGPSARAELPAPLLGELLIKRAMISGAELSEALVLQQGTSKKLGEVLIAMKVITADELAQVMEEQRVYRDRGFVWRG